MLTNGLFLDSVYHEHHSTETTLLKVKNDILFECGYGYVTLLVLLELTATFDIVDHDSLIHTLQSLLGLCGSALQWF